MSAASLTPINAPKIPARLFGPAYEASGLAVARELSNQLRIQDESGAPLTTVGYEKLTLSTAGFDEKGLRLTWRESEALHDSKAAFECHILQAAAARTFRQQCPASLTAPLDQLTKQQQSQTIKRRWAFGAVGAFLLIPVLLVALFFMHSDTLADIVADQISIEQEQQLGALTLKQIEQAQPLIQSGEDWEKLNGLGTQLTEGSAYKYQFYILEDATLNAFAIPGGTIVFHQGLLDSVDDWSEVAGVMAHEIQHIEQRHSLKALIKTAGLYLTWGLISGGTSPGLLEELSLNLLDLSFSRDFEREADDMGLDLLLKHEMDPKGLIAFFERLDQVSEGASPPSWFSTHPSSDDRAARLEAKIQQLDHSVHSD